MSLSAGGLYDVLEVLGNTLRQGPSGYIGLDKAGVVCLFTGLGFERWGRPKEMVVGRTYEEILTPPEGKRRMRVIKGVLASGQAVQETDVIYNSARRGKVVQNINYLPLKAKNGSTVGVLVEVEDLTREHTLAEIDYEIAKGRGLDKVLKAVCDGASNLSGVWKNDPKAPKAAVRLFDSKRRRVIHVIGGGAQKEKGRWTAQELKSLYDTLGPFNKELQRMMDTSGGQVFLGRSKFKQAISEGIIQKDLAGKRGIFSMVITPLTWEGKRIGDLRVYNMEEWDPEGLKFIKALAERATIAILNAKEMEDVLTVRERERARERVKNHQIRALLHDIKGVPQIISILTELVGRSIGGVVDGARPGSRLTARRIRELTGALGNLELIREGGRDITDMAFSGSEVLDTEIHPEAARLSIVDVVREVAKPYVAAAGREKIPFTVNIKPNLPDAFAVEKELRRVMQNLVQNALTHVEPKGPRGRIEVNVGEDGDFLTVSMTNTGKQIPSEQIKTIFEGTGKSKSGGWGVGLSGAKTLISRIGGTIKAFNTNDEQDRDLVEFTFTLPKYQPPLD